MYLEDTPISSSFLLFQKQYQSFQLSYNFIYSMGSEKSKHIEEQDFTSDNAHLKDAKVIAEKDERYIQAKFPTQGKQYDNWKSLLAPKKQHLNSEFLLLADKTDFKHDKGLCSDTGTLINNYPYYPYLLSQEIKGRQSDLKLFKESDLWYLLYALSSAKHNIKQYSQRIGDIKPENVFVNADQKIKVASVLSWPNQTSNYAKVIDHDHPDWNVLLAPEDFVELSKGATDNKVNTQSEIFSIGATVLSAGLLDNLADVYDYKNHNFNVAAFRAKLKAWAASPKYSEIFKSIILNLVDLNPENRLTADELHTWISKYQHSIRDREQFLIPRAPEKIQSHVSVLRSKAI